MAKPLMEYSPHDGTCPVDIDCFCSTTWTSTHPSSLVPVIYPILVVVVVSLVDDQPLRAPTVPLFVAPLPTTHDHAMALDVPSLSESFSSRS